MWPLCLPCWGCLYMSSSALKEPAPLCVQLAAFEIPITPILSDCSPDKEASSALAALLLLAHCTLFLTTPFLKFWLSSSCGIPFSGLKGWAGGWQGRTGVLVSVCPCKALCASTVVVSESTENSEGQVSPSQGPGQLSSLEGSSCFQAVTYNWGGQVQRGWPEG